MTVNRSSAFAPIVAVFLLVLAGCGSGTMSPGSPNDQDHAVGSRTGNAMCQPDFTFALSPSSATITSGHSVRVSVEMSSLCGLAGTINVGIRSISPPPSGSNGFTINQPRYDIPLDANGTAVAYITLGATPNTLKTTYTLTIQGKDISGGCCYGLKHSAAFELTVK
ncbi:MAG TPA: hypothetical protein VMT95_01910 [Candidatus Binatia bacterium]|nr:hypothetical protein [Candidatus Binatia bacterium]